MSFIDFLNEAISTRNEMLKEARKLLKNLSFYSKASDKDAEIENKITSYKNMSDSELQKEIKRLESEVTYMNNKAMVGKL